MTDLEIRQPAAAQLDQTPGIDLKVWAEQAQSAAIYAEAVCRTSMVPSAYKGKPEEATAAILAGAELGFSPMASLRAFDNISGTPAPKAMTLRAVVQAAGHEVVIEQSTNEQAVVSGRRKGTDTWQTSVWDVARAEQLAQFKSNPNYRTNRAQMLAARATAEVCRWIAADAIMGMPYAAEEIGDLAPPAPVAHRLTVAELDAPRTHPADGRELAPGYMADPDAARKAAEFPGYIDPSTLVVEHVTRDQQKHMFALWSELGYSKSEEDRVKRLWLTAQILGLPEALESSDDLTRDQADQVIAALVERKAKAGGGTDA